MFVSLVLFKAAMKISVYLYYKLVHLLIAIIKAFAFEIFSVCHQDVEKINYSMKIYKNVNNVMLDVKSVLLSIVKNVKKVMIWLMVHV